MRAIRLHGRGGAEDLIYEVVPKPRPSEGEVLIRVYATGITPTELTWSSGWRTREGKDRLPAVPGYEPSGVVAEIGGSSADLHPGDPIYALADFWRDGAAAEYVVVHAANVAPKPQSLDHIQAAAVPLSALTAWQALFDHGRLSEGQRVLIHGAAGGVGSLAVQLARARGAYVIGTSSGRNARFLRDLGVNDVIDYAATPFESVAHDMDVVVDTVGGDTLTRSWGVLKRGGTLVSIAGRPSEEEADRRSMRGVYFIVEPNRSELVEITRLIDSEKVHPIVGAVFPLGQARQAYERGLSGHTRGKIVLQVVT